MRPLELCFERKTGSPLKTVSIHSLPSESAVRLSSAASAAGHKSFGKGVKGKNLFQKVFPLLSLSVLLLLLCFDIGECVFSRKVDTTLIVYLHNLYYNLIAYGNNVLYLFNTVVFEL